MRARVAITPIHVSIPHNVKLITHRFFFWLPVFYEPVHDKLKGPRITGQQVERALKFKF